MCAFQKNLKLEESEKRLPCYYGQYTSCCCKGRRCITLPVCCTSLCWVLQQHNVYSGKVHRSARHPKNLHKNLCLIFRNYYAFILTFWMLLKTKEMMLFYIVSEMKILSHTIFCLWLCIYILKINKKYVFRILVETLMQAFSVLFAFLRKDIIIKG